MTMRAAHTILATALVIVGVACQPRQAGDSPTDDVPDSQRPAQGAEGLAGARAAVVAAIGDAPCAHTDQCRSIAMGSKPCGGPRNYLAYSVTNTDSLRVAALAAEFTRLDTENNQRTGAISDCSITPRPPVACDAGRCVLAR